MPAYSNKPVSTQISMVCAPMHVKLSPARIWAANTITAILDHGKSMDDVLAEGGSFAAMSPRDRALARAIAGTVLRRSGQVDAVLGLYLSRPLPQKAGLMRAIMRCATAEILFLRSPAFAIVNEAVSQAASKGKTRAFRHLANAVLRKVATEGADRLNDFPPSLNIPDWLQTSWQAAYGDQVIADAARVLIADQPTDITVFGDAKVWAEKLNGHVLGGHSVRIDSHDRQSGDVTKWPGFEEGAWQVQDAAASLPVALLAPKPGEYIADLCAAPGGKTAQLASSGAKVIALDRAQNRLLRLDQNMKRLGLSVQSLCADVMQWQSDAPLDAVLLDAPCSATGVFRRHPDVLALKSEEQVRALADMQFAILKAAIQNLRPGGRLVYCVCSAQGEEGEQIAARALAELPLKAANIDPKTLPFGQEFVSRHALRIAPGAWAEKGGLDAFYMATFTKKA